MDLYRINVTDTHGREEGRIETIDGHDVFYVERKPNIFGDVSEAQLQAAAPNGIRCVLLPIVASYLTQNGINAVYGKEMLDHPDVIPEGIYCNMVSANTFGIHMPFADMDGLYDLCGRLVGVPIRTELYNLAVTLDEVAEPDPIIYPEEIVIMLMPIGGYLATVSQDTIWKEKYFSSNPDIANGIQLELDRFLPKQRVKDIYTMAYNTYGFLDVIPDVLEVSDDNSKASIPVEMQGSAEENSLPDILAWINAIGSLREDLYGDGELSENTKFWMNYRANDVVFPEPTEEEMHPWNPDEIDPRWGLTNQEMKDLEERGIYPPYPPELIPVEYGGTRGQDTSSEEDTDTEETPAE